MFAVYAKWLSLSDAKPATVEDLAEKQQAHFLRHFHTVRVDSGCFAPARQPADRAGAQLRSPGGEQVVS